jgi:hypothetical protein
MHPVANVSHDVRIGAKVINVPSSEILLRVIGALPCRCQPPSGFVEELLAARLFAVNGDEPRDQQTADNGYHRGAHRGDCGQERIRISHLKPLMLQTRTERARRYPKPLSAPAGAAPRPRPTPPR